jgi:hypothetical protein
VISYLAKEQRIISGGKPSARRGTKEEKMKREICIFLTILCPLYILPAHAGDYATTPLQLPPDKEPLESDSSILKAPSQLPPDDGPSERGSASAKPEPLGSYGNPVEDKPGQGDWRGGVHRGMYCVGGRWHHGWLQAWEESPVIKPSCGVAAHQAPR